MCKQNLGGGNLKALITGITGFCGSWLAEHLLKQNLEVHGTIRQRSNLENIKHIENRINMHYCDLTDASSLRNLLTNNEFDYIFHLGAISYVLYSWENPSATIETNVVGTTNLLEAIRTSKGDPSIQIAASSEEYGLVYPNELPIKETNPLRPLSPYGVSKVAADLLSQQYYRSYGIKTVITRAFNHSGPRRGEVFVTSNFAKQIVEIEKGREPIMHVGNLNAKRDFSDVRDIVRAYWLATNKCDYGEVYNICSEKARTIQSVLDLLLDMTDKKVEIKQDPSRMRPSDVDVLQGDCSKFKEQTGWKSEIPFEKTMRDLLDYWRDN